VKAISEIVEALIQAHRARKNINLSSLKQQYASKNNLSGIPKTVDIIAAIPENYKKQILPKIKAKPVRTASGVRVHR
jgi:elongator complex protein 3